MGAHQVASSASSAREKWIRPLVVGPSPVITPSRTTASASAAVSRQEIFDGSGAPPGSANLGKGADIGISSQFLVPDQHFHAGVNERLTIRNSNRGFFIGSGWSVWRRSRVRGVGSRPGCGGGGRGAY